MTATKKTAPNKAQLIREALKKFGIDAPASTVQGFAKLKGVSIAAAQISNIRTKLKGNGAPTKKAGTVTAEELIQARTLANKLGGVDRTRQLLDVLIRLN